MDVAKRLAVPSYRPRLSWCELEAKRILERASAHASDRAGFAGIAFQAGFGPSGLPHIGTLCEVLRTSFVMAALRRLTRIPARLFVVSDDLDALRRVPADFPQQQLLEKYIGVPLCRVPDPFGEASSLSEAINRQLIALLNEFEIDHCFVRSSEAYGRGEYDPTLRLFLQHQAAIDEVVAHSVGPIRRSSYSMFMPISPVTGRVIEHLRVLEVDVAAGRITYEIPDDLVIHKPGEDFAIAAHEFYPGEPIGTAITVSALGGSCKLQWKADWCMRMMHRDIAYEMHGEDLADSARVVRGIFQRLGKREPLFYQYGLFTDERGSKISKSKGNGFTLSQALDFLGKDSLRFFLHRRPSKARRFSPLLACAINDAFSMAAGRTAATPPLNCCASLRAAEGVVSSGAPPSLFSKLTRILSSCSPVDRQGALLFLSRYRVRPASSGQFLFDKAWNYYVQYVKPQRRSATPPAREKMLLLKVAQFLEASGDPPSAVRLHEGVRAFATECGVNLDSAYRALYLALTNSSCGPRLATWIEITGVATTAGMLRVAFNSSHM